MVCSYEGSYSHIELDNQIGYWKKCKKRKCFIALANFGLRLMKCILPPPNLPKESGFMVEIAQKRKHGIVKRLVCIMSKAVRKSDMLYIIYNYVAE